MTNYGPLAASPRAAASMVAADRIVVNDPDNPMENYVTTLPIFAAGLELLKAAASGIMTTGALAAGGILAGVGTIYKNSVSKTGGIRRVEIMIDLTGLASSTTDLDIIGTGLLGAYLGRVLAAELGTVLTVEMKCLEAPAGGVTDIDLYSATEATGVFDGAIASLTETALLSSAGAWTNGRTLGATVVPAANEYLYLVCGAAGTAATYTAGKFLIVISGYDA